MRFMRNAVIVIAIIGVAIFLIASFQPTYTPARRTTSINNLRTIGLALYAYHDRYGELPPASTFDEKGRPLHGWMTQLLPFIDLGGLYDQIDQSRPWDDPSQTAFGYPIKYFQNPRTHDDRSTTLTGYAGNSRIFKPRKSLSLAEITDAKAGTLLIGEVNDGFVHWGAPGNIRDPALGFDKGPRTFGSPDSYVVLFLMADGSARTVNKSIDASILEALATPNGGEDFSKLIDSNRPNPPAPPPQ